MKKMITACLLTFLLLPFAVMGAALSLMSSLDGKTIRFDVTDTTDASNPNHGASYQLHFSKTDYYYEDEKSKSRVSGRYEYKILNPEKGIALINFHEKYSNAVSDYSTVLYANDAKSGLYIYKQSKGPVLPKHRMNFGSYEIL